MSKPLKKIIKEKNNIHYNKLHEYFNRFNSLLLCHTKIINSKLLHKIREDILPSKLYVGKKSITSKYLSKETKVPKKFINKIGRNTFIIFTNESEKIKELIEDLPEISGYPQIGDEVNICIEKGPLVCEGKPLSGALFKDLKEFNISNENNELILNETLNILKTDRKSLNLLKLLKIESEKSRVEILDIYC